MTGTIHCASGFNELAEKFTLGKLFSTRIHFMVLDAMKADGRRTATITLPDLEDTHLRLSPVSVSIYDTHFQIRGKIHYCGNDKLLADLDLKPDSIVELSIEDIVPYKTPTT